MAILVTGGAGFIGSHTVLSLLNRGDDVIILDNLSNSSLESIRRIEMLSTKKITIYKGDILDYQFLRNIFFNHKVNSVIHFAAFKAIGESIKKPLEYYTNNVTGSLILLKEMSDAGVNQLIFSSSATVYGANAMPPCVENSQIGETTNPYGTSKVMVEKILNDYANVNPNFKIIALRYFNPVGAHESGMIGEDPCDVPNNLFPYISQVAIGRLKKLSIFGGDYPTKDGTAERDYIHVMDLAEGHLKALDYIASIEGYKAYNLGSGRGYSVLEIVKAFEKASERQIPYEICQRRDGDLPSVWADPTLAYKELNWCISRGLDVIMRDTWNWQSKNPNGYR